MKTVVDAKDKTLSLDLGELIKYKDLFLILAYRDYRVRYAQTYLGFIWAIVRPALTLLIFTLVFGKAAKIDTGNIPYPVFAIVGMSAWTYFSFVMSQAGNSIIGAGGMIKKIYFPRLVIPLGKSLVGLIDFAIVFVFQLCIMLYYGFPLSLNIIYLPLFFIANIFSSLAIGLWISSLNVRYRDFMHVIPFLVQFGLYVTPIAYPAELLVNQMPEWASIIYYLNPVAGIVEGFRFSVLGTPFTNWYAMVSFAAMLLLFVSGLYYFKRIEKIMADIV